MAIEIHVEGAAELRQRLGNASQELASETRAAMTAGLLLLESAARRNAPRDTGRLQGSITHRIEGSGANLTGTVAPSVRYGYWVEHGRRAGRQPPIGAISGWASRHGIHPFVLARAIGRRGTRAQPFMQPALDANRGRVISLFERIGVRVAAFIAR